MRINTIQLNNNYSKPFKNNKVISFTGNSSNEYPNITRFASLPNKPVAPKTLARAFRDLIDAFKYLLKSPKDSGGEFSQKEMMQYIEQRLVLTF